MTGQKESKDFSQRFFNRQGLLMLAVWLIAWATNCTVFGVDTVGEALIAVAVLVVIVAGIAAVQVRAAGLAGDD